MKPFTKTIMDCAYCDVEYICDVHKRKQHPAPIVSLGRIISYKLGVAGIDIAHKTMDVFNQFDRKLTKMKGRPFKKSVSFKDNEEATDDRHDRNVNATPGKIPEIKYNNHRKSVTKRKTSRQQKKYNGKDQKVMPPEGDLCSERKIEDLKTKTEVKTKAYQKSTKGLCNKLGSKKEFSTTNKTYQKSDQEVSSSKVAERFETTSLKSVRKACGRRKTPRSDSHKKAEDSSLDMHFTRKSNKKEMLMYVTQQLKLKQSESPYHKMNNRVLRKRSPELIKPTENEMVKLFKERQKTEARLITSSSPVNASIGKRRWADVVAGTSKCRYDTAGWEENGREVGKDENKTNGENSLTDDTTLTKHVSKISHDEAKSGNSKPQKTVKKSLSYAGSSKQLFLNTDQPSESPSVIAVGSSYSGHFPSLEEQKGEKFCLRRLDKHKDDGVKFVSKRKRKCKKECVYFPIFDKLKQQEKRKRDKKSRMQAKCRNKKDKAQGQMLQMTTQMDCASNGSWYIIDDMPEVFIQPVGKVCPLHEMKSGSEDKSSKKDLPAHFTVVAIDTYPEKDDKMDICSQLNAMSVDGNPECSSSFYCKGKRLRADSSPKGVKSPRVKLQKDAGRSTLDEPGSSQKKISKRYRALMRRDYGKVDAKTATEIFNRGRKVDSHQREKLHDRFDSHQQRRTQLKSNNLTTNPQDTSGGSDEGGSQTVYDQNTLFYCVSQKNGCPTM